MTEDQMIEKIARDICPLDGRCESCNANIGFTCSPKQTAKRVYEAGYRTVDTTTAAETVQKMQARLKKELRDHIPFGLERTFNNIIDRVAREVMEGK
jgi:DNA polymerase II large subunit